MLRYVSRNKKTLCFIFVLLCILLSGCSSREKTQIKSDAGSGMNVSSECGNTSNPPSETEVPDGTKLTGIQEKVSAQVNAGEQRNHLLEHIETYKNVKDAGDFGFNASEAEDRQVPVAQERENANPAGLLEAVSAQTNRYEDCSRLLELIKEYKKEVG